jgi:pteridine reductase
MDALDLRGKAVLVTGAGVRVGRAIALAFGRAGADVAVHHHRSRGDAEETAAALLALGRRAPLVQGDLAEPDAPARLVAEAVAALGGLDVLVNSAAAFEKVPADQLSRERWDAMLASNLTGPFFLAQAAHPHLAQRRGALLNLLDLNGTAQVWPGYAHYTAAKAGLAALTRLLAVEWAPAVRVNGIAPGTVLFPDSLPPDERARIVRRIPAGHEGTPEDAARAAVFLCTQPFVSGQILAVDGARSAAP